jgi:two-component system, OmpR family, phosphate regulon sensor histidine kinase PhoR
MLPKKLIRQLFLSYLLIMGIPMIFTGWYFSHSFKKFYMTQSMEELKSQAWLIGSQVEEHIARSSTNNIDSLCKFLAKKVKTRFTVISPTGKVLGDSEKNPDSMENHLNRTEVLAAVSGKVGIADRYSHTLKKEMIYTTVPIYAFGHIAAVVRTAFPLLSVKAVIAHLVIKNYWAIIIMALLAVMVSYLFSQRISLPIAAIKNGAQRFAAGDFSTKLPVSGYEETRQLAIALNEMGRKLSDMISRITEQNHELDAVLSSMSEGVIAIDAQEKIILVNNAAAKMFAIDQKRATGKWIGEALRNNEIREFLVKALSATKPVEEEIILPLPISEAIGSECFLQLHGSALHDPSLKSFGALMVINDITRIKKLENIRQDFVANVSHELRTPLTSIKGFIETLAAGAVNDPNEARRFLGILSKQADRLNMIVEDLLSLSRIERDTEKKAIDLQDGRIIDVLTASIEACTAKARSKSISIECLSDQNVIAKIERTLLEQAVMNLIDNAINYSNSNTHIIVQAGYSQTDHNGKGGEVVISVRDEGVGIAQEHLFRLFERFYRVDKARSRKLGGTGLGLSIVKHIVLAHGGRVDVQSSPGSGSVFFIYLPRS